MAKLKLKKCHNHFSMRSYRQQIGFTLVEVLIALAIVSIAMTAVIKVTTENIRATRYLKNKTIAMWVGELVMNEMRLKLTDQSNSDESTQTREMLGRNWYVVAAENGTANKRITKIEVKVYENENIDDDAQTPLASLEGYRYEAK